MDAALIAVTERMRGAFGILDGRLSPRNAKGMVDVYVGRYRNCSLKADAAIERKLMVCRNSFNLYDRRLDPERLAERMNGYSISLDNLSSKIDNSIMNSIASRKAVLDSISGKMDGLDPNNVLSRGYSLIRDGGGNVVTSAKDLFPGTDVTIAMRDGTALAKIKELRLDE